jgi:hypothetical protein
MGFAAPLRFLKMPIYRREKPPLRVTAATHWSLFSFRFPMLG